MKAWLVSVLLCDDCRNGMTNVTGMEISEEEFLPEAGLVYTCAECGLVLDVEE